MDDQFQLTHQVVESREVDGIEMGILDDGTPYVTSRGLASLCGVAVSAILTQKKQWAAGNRSSKLAKLLLGQGFDRPELCGTCIVKGTKQDAWTDDVAMVMLEYYGFEVPNPSDIARQYFRKLARSSLRLFIYAALGLDPVGLVPGRWRDFHDRLLLHTEPSGYFSVFKEMANLVISAIKAGLWVDSHTVPDISVGKTWAKHWGDNPGLEKKFGKRIKHEHNFPDRYPQAASNPQEIFVYPVDALGEFRRWMENDYLPERFPKYLDNKVKSGLMPALNAKKLLAQLGASSHAALK